jgi:two-component system chemotaxis sensor kinase CheA
MQSVVDIENIVERILGFVTAGSKSKSDYDINIDRMFKSSDTTNVGSLSQAGYFFSPDEVSEHIYETVKLNPAISEFTVIDNDFAVGFLTRTALNEMLGGRYGFTLHARKPIREIMDTDFLRVDHNMPVDYVARLAMQRPFGRLYNPIVVEIDGKYSGVVTVKDLLDTCTKIVEAERDKIALMRDNLKIGLFFMDRSYIIQNQYSRYLEELFSQTDLMGKSFIDLLSISINAQEIDGIKDYLHMVFEQTFDQDMLDEINPLTELHYIGVNSSHRKVFQCGFAPIINQGEDFMLVSIYDITARVELQQRLNEEENKRQEEMTSFFELFQVEPQVFGDFLEDTEYEFDQIDDINKNESMSTQEKLVRIYQSVHAIKSNAVILGLNTFGSKAHSLETKIKKLREPEAEVPFYDMLNLSVELEKLYQEKEGFKTKIDNINSFKSTGDKNRKQGKHILVEALKKTAHKAALDMGKNIQFIIDEIDNEAIKKGPRRIIKEVLVQLIRNSVAHGIEAAEDRTVNGKSETGVIRLSIKMNGGNIHIKLGDDGHGLDFDKIAKKALFMNLLKKEDTENKDALLKVIFMPGFSTAETEGIHAGRGIGLNLVQDRIRSANGSVKIKTESGKGTIFKITFPTNLSPLPS